MNLFIESLADYLKTEWDRALQAPAGSREARLIVQSLDPEGTLALFQALDAHRESWSPRTDIRCYFRVAWALWDAWRSPSADGQEPNPSVRTAIQELENCDWIDHEDHLTWYRDRTLRDEGVESLVVVLVGFNHATDQGSLADLHRIDEDRVWSELGGNFQPWLERIGQRLGLSPSATELERFDEFLRQLFQLRPRRLGRLAGFLQPLIDQGGCYSFAEFRERVFKALPFWDIPPFLADAQSAVPNGREAILALKEADAFISHQGYKTKAGQKKDLVKIEKALAEPGFVPPLDINGEAVFENVEDYRNCLHAFIEQADPVARGRLLRVNFMPLWTALKKKPDKSPKPEKKTVPAFEGLSFHVLLQGIWDALLKFQKALDKEPLVERLAGISVRLVCFEHDLSPDDDEDIGVDELARDLLHGCLGGLEQRFQEMDLRLPMDEDEARLPRGQWQRAVPIALDLALAELVVKAARGSQRPNVQFVVNISDLDKNLLVEDEPYRWYLDATQPERVRHSCAKRVQRSWSQHGAQADRILPAFRVEQVDLTAMFFAADADEANRLVAQAVQKLELGDLRADLPDQNLDHALREKTAQLIKHYRQWLDANLEHGYYSALLERAPAIITAYDALATTVLDASLLGAQELLRRLYKAFLLIDEQALANDPYLSSAVAWGLTPAVLELSLAQTRFLADGFPEAVAELALGSMATGKAAFNRLLDLSRIQRPITALVTDSSRSLSTDIRSFGLLHCIGEVPDTAKSLAVQTLLKEDESNDDEDVSDIVRPCEEQSLVVKVLDLYRELHPFAQDGLRILAVNVRELPTILAGVDAFLKQALQYDKEDLPPFYCTVTVYSTSSSPLAMENRLALWRERVIANHLENGRGLELTVGHRFAPKHQIVARLEQERRIHDVAFLFHFLRTNMDGQVSPALPFDMGQGGWNGFFPIAEYPRPIKSGARDHREMLISNRRLRIQTRHSDLSARLRIAGHASVDHVVYGQVDFADWADVLQALHAHSQWVACIDSFVDKRLLSPSTEPGRRPDGGRRKIVGFESGLGAYGELNLTISTEQDTLDLLTKRVADELTALLPFEQSLGNLAVAERVVADAEEVIGLASLRAVLGQGEKIREVIGFAAIRRILTTPAGEMSQLLPLDAQTHWFADADVTRRPDLLQLTLEVRPETLPLIHATVIECKLAGQNPVHEAKALAQVIEGLRHLTGLFAPQRDDLHRLSFDRRYWWAQLHRAIASRAVVTLPERDCQQLDHALESLAEGRFEIAWRGLVFTFWTDVAGPQPTLSMLTPNEPAVAPPFVAPSGFAIEQVQLGYQGLAAILAKPESALALQPSGPTIRLTPQNFTVMKPDVKAVDEEEDARPPTSQHDQSTNTLCQTERPATSAVDEERPLEPEPEPDARLRLKVEAFPVPEAILIGTRPNGEPVYWHFGHPGLLNRHLLIFGTAGSGKTYGIQCLLAEMANVGLRSLIVDYTDGFLPGQVATGFKESARLKDHFVYTERLPLNPFRRQHQIIDPSMPAIEEGSFEVASRIQSIFASVFDMGDQQSAALIRSLQSGLDQNPAFSLDGLLPRLREDSPQGESLANKLEPLIQSRPFCEGVESAWDDMLTSPDHRVHVLQLKGLAREIQKMVTEFVLWDLWDYAQNTGNKNRPIPIVLDEIQNLDHGSASPIDKLLREGRKFGISLMLATQTTSQFNQEQKARLFQASHKLFFKPAATELDQFAQILDQATLGVSKAEWVQRLAKLEKGQCWSLGPVLKSGGTLKDEAVLVSVTSLDQRQLEG